MMWEGKVDTTRAIEQLVIIAHEPRIEYVVSDALDVNFAAKNIGRHH